LSCVVSAGAVAVSLDGQSTLCILGIQMAFLLYANVHDVLNVLIGQMLFDKFHKDEVLVYQFLMGESYW
jgi:hypothetical protein